MRFPLALFDTILQRDVGETLLHAFIERTRQHYVRRCGTAARTVVALCNIQSGRSAISLFRRSFLCAWRILHTQTFVFEEKRRLLAYRRMIFRTILNDDIRLYLAVLRQAFVQDPFVTNLAECTWYPARYKLRIFRCDRDVLLVSDRSNIRYEFLLTNNISRYRKLEKKRY